jgi:hypothetical protein
MIDKNEQLSRLGEGLNAMGQQMQLSLEMSKRDRRKNLAIILYSRVLSLFQSILHGVDSGQFAEAYAILPDIIDSAFATAAVVNSEAAAECFFEGNTLQQIYRHKRCQDIPREVGGKIRDLSGHYFARQVGMAEYCSAFHHLLWRANKTTQEGRPEYLTAAGTIELNPLLPACETMFLATRQVADFFGIGDLDKEYYEYWRGFSKLVASEQAA